MFDSQFNFIFMERRFQKSIIQKHETNPGLYIHIPFCKKACHYCNFYFTLSTSQKDKYIDALCCEITLRKDDHNQAEISTIYFGGGTPSLLSIVDYEKILCTIFHNYSVSKTVEISTETNPENLSLEFLQNLKSLNFNRISIGVQSFVEDDLISMNRNHDAAQSILAIENTTNVFENVSIDLMFGLPYSGFENWKKNLQKAVELNVQHISTYNLTIEEKTALAKKIERKELSVEPDNMLNEMYFYTLDYLAENGFINYEISNFGKENNFSNHNLNYWNGTPYLGFGPSSHSYDGINRRSNISNLNQYLSKLESKETYWEIENLSLKNQYNEFVLTRLRTIYGIDELTIKLKFEDKLLLHFEHQIEKFISQKLIQKDANIYTLTREGKVLADYITSELMID
jgi:oxygen-independent coproporphyrinogen III oxidase